MIKQYFNAEYSIKIPKEADSTNSNSVDINSHCYKWKLSLDEPTLIQLKYSYYNVVNIIFASLIILLLLVAFLIKPKNNNNNDSVF